MGIQSHTLTLFSCPLHHKPQYYANNGWYFQCYHIMPWSWRVYVEEHDVSGHCSLVYAFGFWWCSRKAHPPCSFCIIPSLHAPFSIRSINSQRVEPPIISLTDTHTAQCSWLEASHVHMQMEIWLESNLKYFPKFVTPSAFSWRLHHFPTPALCVWYYEEQIFPERKWKGLLAEEREKERERERE